MSGPSKLVAKCGEVRYSRTMTRGISILTRMIGFVALFVTPAFCQPLPKIELRRVFPELTFNRPVWMSEAPDGSDRFFLVEQDGRIVIIQKGASGKETKEFMNIVERKPHVDNEEGLLGLAFHPGFKTNGHFYVYYNQQ